MSKTDPYANRPERRDTNSPACARARDVEATNKQARIDFLVTLWSESPPLWESGITPYQLALLPNWAHLRPDTIERDGHIARLSLAAVADKESVFARFWTSLLGTLDRAERALDKAEGRLDASDGLEAEDFKSVADAFAKFADLVHKTAETAAKASGLIQSGSTVQVAVVVGESQQRLSAPDASKALSALLDAFAQAPPEVREMVDKRLAGAGTRLALPPATVEAELTPWQQVAHMAGSEDPDAMRAAMREVRAMFDEVEAEMGGEDK